MNTESRDSLLTKHLLLLRKRTRIQAVTDTPKGETHVREKPFASLTERIGEQLCHIGLDRDGWLAYGEQLVDEGENDDEPYADGPSTEGAARGVLVVMVVNDSPNLGVGTIHCDQSRFELHLLDENGILLRMLGNLIVI